MTCSLIAISAGFATWHMPDLPHSTFGKCQGSRLRSSDFSGPTAS